MSNCSCLFVVFLANLWRKYLVFHEHLYYNLVSSESPFHALQKSEMDFFEFEPEKSKQVTNKSGSVKFQ